MPFANDVYYHAFEGPERTAQPVGEKPAVVLIHGAGGNHLYWPVQIRRLPGYRIYAPDLPGHGKSAGRGHQSIESYAQSMIEWLSAAGLHQAVFIGHSMGAAIALTLALDYSEHVLGLGLIGAGARLQVSPELLESTASPTTFHNAVEFATRYSFAAETSPRLVELAAKRMAETRPSVLHSDFLACSRFDVTERVSAITQPTLVLTGAEDRMVPKRYSVFLSGAIPNAQLVLIPGAGHNVMLEKPHEVAEAIGAFLEEHFS